MDILAGDEYRVCHLIFLRWSFSRPAVIVFLEVANPLVLVAFQNDVAPVDAAVVVRHLFIKSELEEHLQRESCQIFLVVLKKIVDEFSLAIIGSFLI